MRINVAYCTDERYCKIFTVSMVSLFESNKNVNGITVYCLEKGLSEKAKEEITAVVSKYNREIVYIPIQETCDSLRFWSSGRDTMFARLLIPNLLECDKILYIDCDTIVISSLEELWNESVEGYASLVVQDTARLDAKEEAGLKQDDRYFNSGVMVLNCWYWRENNLIQCIKDYESDFDEEGIFPDQRALNGATLKCSKFISPKYNWSSEMERSSRKQIVEITGCDNFYWEEEMHESKKNPCIVHFSGRSIDRPWFTNCEHGFTDKYRSIMRMNEFTDFPLWKDKTLNIIKWKIKYMMPYTVIKSINRLRK